MSRRPPLALSPDEERLAIGRQLAERRCLAQRQGAQGRATDVREHEPFHPPPRGCAPYRDDVQMSPRSSCEADRVAPTRPFREHNVGACRPRREPVELRSPDHRLPSSLDPVPVRRVIGVSHPSAVDPEPVLSEAPHARTQALRARQSSDRPDELGALVGHQPGIEPTAGHRAGSPVDHDARPGRSDEQPCGPMPGRVLGADPDGHEPHGITPHASAPPARAGLSPSDREHRAARRRQHARRHAPEEEAGQPGAPVRAEHQHVRAL